MTFNEFKRHKRLFAKVLSSSIFDELLKLFSNLNVVLTEYIISYREFVFLKEDKSNTYNELLRKIKYSEKEIISLLSQIEEFFNEGFFQELTKEQANSISDEYQELINNTYSLSMMLKSERFKRHISLVSFYMNEVVPSFKKLNKNIEIYNKKALENNWKYKLKSYDDAVDFYKKNLQIIGI